MNHFMRGFASELIKVSAMPQSSVDGIYDASNAFNKAMGKTKPGASPVMTPSAPKRPAPTPITTMNATVGFSNP